MTSTWTRETLSIDVADELKNEISGKTGEQVSFAFVSDAITDFRLTSLVLITGPTTGGLGFQAAHDIAKYAKLVILVGRNPRNVCPHGYHVTPVPIAHI